LKKYLSFIKIEHTLFSLPMIFSGVFLASKEAPALSLMILILTAAVGARLVAMTLNRIIDREIDKHNPRTVNRELPSGTMKLKESYIVLLFGLILYVLSAKLISDFCFYLSPIPLIIFVLYPYLKRFTPLAHFGVGVGLAMGPLGGFFAVTGSFDRIGEALLLPAFNLFWATGFDIIYSTLDEEFDKKSGLFSFPSRFGKKRALQISGVLHLFAFVVLVALVFISLHALIALPFLLLSGFLLWFEQHKAEDVDLAFFKINIVVGFSILVMVLVSA
jgi:4-hydroxybenzoate polyprenyltransferase